MAAIDVNAADLLRAADAYAALAARASLIAPQAAVEVHRIAESHGPMGYPTAVGITAGLASREGPLNAKVADFGTYSERFTEHATTYTRQDAQASAGLKAIPWPEGLREVTPTAHVDPKPPPSRPAGTCCWIGTENGDVSRLCPPDTDTVTYVDKDGNYVAKDLDTGTVTVMMRPGSDSGAGHSCWLGSATADRSICGPNTTQWTYPRDGYLITERLEPDGSIQIIFQTPLGPLAP